MQILFICRFLPHPQVCDAGGQSVYRYILSLSQHHSVSLIAFVTAGQAEPLAAMRSICQEVVAIPYSVHGLLPRLWRAVWRLLLPRVYGRVVSIRYRRGLARLLSRRSFDVVLVDGMMAQYGSLVRGAKKAVDEIDIYSVVAYHTWRKERRWLARLGALCDWLRLQAFELHYASTYDAVLVRSDKDREVLKAYLPWQRVEVIATWFEGFELTSLAPRRPEGNRLLFVGAMNLPKNIEAVSYFVGHILPLIRRQVPDAELYIVGSAPALSVRRLADEEGVVVTGEVDDLTPYYESSAVNVVPLLTGGGIIVKTLNGLAAARPTVATPAGNSGTGAQPGRDLLVVDYQPQEFAAAVIRLLLDHELWQEIAINGQRYVVSHYHWGKAMDQLRRLLETLHAAA